MRTQPVLLAAALLQLCRADHPGGRCCTNDCIGWSGGWAEDGWCDDGGPGAEFHGCALGSDCSDCSVRYEKVDGLRNESCFYQHNEHHQHEWHDWLPPPPPNRPPPWHTKPARKIQGLRERLGWQEGRGDPAQDPGDPGDPAPDHVPRAPARAAPADAREAEAAQLAPELERRARAAPPPALLGAIGGVGMALAVLFAFARLGNQCRAGGLISAGRSARAPTLGPAALSAHTDKAEGAAAVTVEVFS